MTMLDLRRLPRHRFEGVLVVPDVHGHPDALEVAAERASEERLFLLQLGDLVDRGPSSALAVAYMREIEARGIGTFLLGNHENKLARLFRSGAHATPRRVETLDELSSYGEGLLEWYVERIEGGWLWARSSRAVFTHASLHPEMLAEVPRMSDELRMAAMFGPTARVPGKSRPVRDQRWVDLVPADITVYVGHEVASDAAPETKVGRRRGRAVFVDTGGWQGGAWSSVALRWEGLE